MFAQGHGFTQGVYGAGRESERYWEMHNRGRGGPDAGKRELMFPSHQQFPSSGAGPNPSGVNFPFGNQAGSLYPEAGSSQKQQKKKGKKHRHGNTSSSGGTGIVDVADPSILQMRVGNVSHGQSFGGQTQGTFPNSLHNHNYPRW